MSKPDLEGVSLTGGLLTPDTNAIILIHNVPPEGDQIFGDPAAVTGLFKEFNEWYRLFAQDLGTAADKAIDLNKDIASLHERLLLINIGTIGISLSALISLGGRITGNLTARHIFVWYVAPARCCSSYLLCCAAM